MSRESKQRGKECRRRGRGRGREKKTKKVERKEKNSQRSERERGSKVWMEQKWWWWPQDPRVWHVTGMAVERSREEQEQE